MGFNFFKKITKQKISQNIAHVFTLINLNEWVI